MRISNVHELLATKNFIVKYQYELSDIPSFTYIYVNDNQVMAIDMGHVDAVSRMLSSDEFKHTLEQAIYDKDYKHIIIKNESEFLIYCIDN